MCNNSKYLLYKKALFISSKRAILENEYILRSFVKKVLRSKYSLDKINTFINLISRLDDLTLYSLITSRKIMKINKFKLDEIDIVNDIRYYIFNTYKINK